MSSLIDCDKVAIIGSGNWGSAIATVIGPNCARHACLETTVKMYVYEETITLADGHDETSPHGPHQRRARKCPVPAGRVPPGQHRGRSRSGAGLCGSHAARVCDAPPVPDEDAPGHSRRGRAELPGCQLDQGDRL